MRRQRTQFFPGLFVSLWPLGYKQHDPPEAFSRAHFIWMISNAHESKPRNKSKWKFSTREVYPSLIESFKGRGHAFCNIYHVDFPVNRRGSHRISHHGEADKPRAVACTDSLRGRDKKCMKSDDYYFILWTEGQIIQICFVFKEFVRDNWTDITVAL